MLALVLLVLSPLAGATASASTSTYACGNVPPGPLTKTKMDPGHCYDAAHLRVAATPEITADLTLRGPSTGGNGFITHEMWLAPADGSIWIEVGVIAGPGDRERLFWADSRPGSCPWWEWACISLSGPGNAQRNLNVHYGPALTPADYDQPIHLTITRKSSASWDVSAIAAAVSLSGESTDNPFTPETLDVGLELAGTSGASSPPATMTTAASGALLIAPAPLPDE